jgi:hypothetical protein
MLVKTERDQITQQTRRNETTRVIQVGHSVSFLSPSPPMQGFVGMFYS